MSEVTSTDQSTPKSQPLQTSQMQPQIVRGLSENHCIQITLIRLNGDNFLRWSHLFACTSEGGVALAILQEM